MANPQEDVTCEYTGSCLLSRPLSKPILQQEGCIPPNCYDKQKQAKATITRQKSMHIPEATVHVLEEVHVDLTRMTELAVEKEASSWLTALPGEEHGF